MSGRRNGDNDAPPNLSFAHRLSNLLADQSGKILAAAVVAFSTAGFALQSRVTGLEQWNLSHELVFTDFRAEVRDEFEYDRSRVDDIYRQLAQCREDIAGLRGGNTREAAVRN